MEQDLLPAMRKSLAKPAAPAAKVADDDDDDLRTLGVVWNGTGERYRSRDAVCEMMSETRSRTGL